MQITELKVTIGEVCEGYINDAEEGVVGYDERLDIRPKYQREFVYKDKQRDEVIRTVMKGLPLNVIYSNATFRWNCHIGQEPAVRDSIFAYAIEKMNIPFSTFQFRPYLLFHIIQFHYHNTFLQFSVKQL